MYSNGYNVYKNNSVNYASKEQLLLMLTEGAVKFCKMARQAIVDKDIKKAHDALVRTQDIFSELMVSLDTTVGDWAVQLFSVYAFIKEKLVEANIKKSLEIIDEILPLVEDINETWKEAYKRAKL
ncbi:flagellar export chaperone FliS [Clostridium beijerinckii]|uniref:flagellar export chaperone FliS n=1 Tax=Clostridium beijerinckii TaxID=1520 RepID=UPI0013619B7F|nr:flagellar export chaperone FliS [Clostridium beijerinckii]MZK49892.1 flagellar export chaperone FliS [Clostridium beijerinckii]MZK57851.1 flagellar export chaperone FliS [Clostridium beijerinckii]MZK68062.1 flagellar export chaperone FliS [Clostridium beijerinckii]MZK73560.1 flagellar export chaperone FliS [Clostridium beijerinckii]MZK83142.1 flagellar export chaperone FliS [Clostridium beijerinckii]